MGGYAADSIATRMSHSPTRLNWKCQRCGLTQTEIQVPKHASRCANEPRRSCEDSGRTAPGRVSLKWSS